MLLPCPPEQLLWMVGAGYSGVFGWGDFYYNKLMFYKLQFSRQSGKDFDAQCEWEENVQKLQSVHSLASYCFKSDFGCKSGNGLSVQTR